MPELLCIQLHLVRTEKLVSIEGFVNITGHEYCGETMTNKNMSLYLHLIYVSFVNHFIILEKFVIITVFSLSLGHVNT